MKIIPGLAIATGRAKCQMCRDVIRKEKRAVRLLVDNGLREFSVWVHWECMEEKLFPTPARVKEVLENEAEQFYYELLESEGVEDWRVLGEGACTFFRTRSFAESARLVQAIGELPAVGDHPPDLDVRHDGVSVRLITYTEEWYGTTKRDVEVARQISAAARELGFENGPAEGCDPSLFGADQGQPRRLQAVGGKGRRQVEGEPPDSGPHRGAEVER